MYAALPPPLAFVLEKSAAFTFQPPAEPSVSVIVILSVDDIFAFVIAFAVITAVFMLTPVIFAYPIPDAFILASVIEPAAICAVFIVPDNLSVPTALIIAFSISPSPTLIFAKSILVAALIIAFVIEFAAFIFAKSILEFDAILALVTAPVLILALVIALAEMLFSCTPLESITTLLIVFA